MKDTKKVKKEKTPFMTTKQRSNNTVEVEIQKSPAKTLLGKIFLVLIIAGTLLVPLALLIYLMTQM